MARWFVDLTDLATWGGPAVSFPLTAGQMAAWIAEAANPTPRLCFSAVEAEDRPWGHVQFLHDAARRWARLGRFAVAPGWRGRGFGRALFGRAVAYAFDELGVDHIVLAVARDNRLAHAMYVRSGFTGEGRETSVRAADGVTYVVDIMGLSRANWIKRKGAPLGVAKVA